MFDFDVVTGPTPAIGQGGGAKPAPDAPPRKLPAERGAPQRPAETDGRRSN